MNYYLAIVITLIVLTVTPASADQASVARGKEVYLSYGCAVCHGKEGKGDGLNAKTFDPSPTNFYDTKKYRHGISKMDLIYSIKNGAGEPGAGMPGFKYLTKEELDDIAAYLVSLQQK